MAVADVAAGEPDRHQALIFPPQVVVVWSLLACTALMDLTYPYLIYRYANTQKSINDLESTANFA